MDVVCEVMKQNANSITEDDFTFLKSLSIVCLLHYKLTDEAINLLGNAQLKSFTAAKLPPNFMMFLEFAVALAGHPSPTVSLSGLPFWNAFLSNSDVQSQVERPTRVHLICLGFRSWIV